MRVLKLLVVLVLAAVVGLAGYAYLGDMEPSRQEVRSPVAGAGGTAGGTGSEAGSD
ncbi:hypothetical protein [Paracoccus spongiarum]|uniref:Efflux RND transporter periplasmic adaptor subunit n=1 Tax=Paracoccus spongiarum TaxID=3064387 RepID=A0ABT9J825_9RHOB|nr:hypothetical protein [Paracoccus sp. 2205BS29-5]MDP5305968.1 hypothetical protein [Paracoccus sp. 2205BS29-5]